SGGWTTPSPHVLGPQVAGHASPSLVFPSSHVSTPLHTTPSPQRAFWQLARHASSSLVFPSSHSSPGSRTPLPHVVAAWPKSRSGGVREPHAATVIAAAVARAHPTFIGSLSHDQGKVQVFGSSASAFSGIASWGNVSGNSRMPSVPSGVAWR